MQLNCSGNQVDQWVHRARLALAKTLAPYFPQYGLPGGSALDEAAESAVRRNPDQDGRPRPEPPTVREAGGYYGSTTQHDGFAARQRLEPAYALLVSLDRSPLYSAQPRRDCDGIQRLRERA